MEPIVLDLFQCAKISQWQQYFMIPGVEEVSELFDEPDKKRGKGKKWHSYKSKITQIKIMEDISTEELIQEEAIDDHFVLSKGNFIPTVLSDYYFFMFHGKVPDK